MLILFLKELLRVGIAGAVVYCAGFVDLRLHLVRHFDDSGGGAALLAEVSLSFLPKKKNTNRFFFF